MIETSLKMEEVSEETMGYFSEFCYTGDYNADSGVWDRCRLKLGAMGSLAENLEDREKALAHARLYVFAKRFNIEALQELAVENLGKFMASCAIEGITVIPCLVDYALENIPEATTTDRLVTFLAKCTAWVIRFRCSSWKQFHRLLASIDREDFFTSFCEYNGHKTNTVRPW